MKIKYNEGDIFTIPLDNGRYSICQVIWAPKTDYKKVFSFCVLENNKSTPIWNIDKKKPLSLKDGDRSIKVIFTGVKKIANGDWEIIGCNDSSNYIENLKIFNIAGALHDGDDFIRKLTIDEYEQYPSMSIFGFELVRNILINS